MTAHLLPGETEEEFEKKKQTYKNMNETPRQRKAREEKEESPEKKLYNYIKEMNMTFCIDQFSNDVAIYKNNYYPIKENEFKSIIAEIYFEEKDCLFNDTTWKKVLTILSAKCSHKTTFFPLRCHTIGRKIYYDDGIVVWEFYNGQYSIYDRSSEECPVIFRRYKHQLRAELNPNDLSTKAILEDITSFFNIHDFRVETILPMFSSEQPEPMKLFTGEPGSAKSTFSLFIKRLVDPNEVEKISLPDKNHLSDFNLHRQNFYVILYDNIREFTKEHSDQLCMMITGGTGVSRSLFTNGELYISKGLPRIICNGLRPEPTHFNDLLDRTLLIVMERVDSRPEKEVWDRINFVLPELRFCCLRDISKAIYLDVEEAKNLPRMSEHCLLGQNITKVWKEENSFIEWFKYRMQVSHATGMDDPLMIILNSYLETNTLLLKGEGIKMTGSEWRLRLIDYARQYEEGIGYLYKDLFVLSQEKEFPANANWMGRRFRDLSPLLKIKGYSVEVVRTASDRSIRVYIK